jgi:hypothetical protein
MQYKMSSSDDLGWNSRVVCGEVNHSLYPLKGVIKTNSCASKFASVKQILPFVRGGTPRL